MSFSKAVKFRLCESEGGGGAGRGGGEVAEEELGELGSLALTAAESHAV